VPGTACMALSALLAFAPAFGQSDAPPPPAKKDRYLVRLGAPASEGATPQLLNGRLILFFLPDTRRWDGIAPAGGPFLTAPQPIASIAVKDASEGSEVAIEVDPLTTASAESTAVASLAELDGAWKVQAVFDSDFTEAGHLGPGNLVSEPVAIELARDATDEVAIALETRIAAPAAEDAAVRGVERFERASTMLGAALRRSASIRATVVLPFGYDDLAYPRRMWPTIYVLGDFGSKGAEAFESASVLRDPGARAAVPQAVWVFLDSSSPWGHRAFCDSDAHGPVARALVEEFIPALEERFRLISEPGARVLLGHGFGGWNAIHLALTAPGTFGSCFASAPDFVDFSAVGRIDLYRDASMFTARDGTDAPAVRSILGPNDDRLHLTLREQMLAERAVDPMGRSGQRWAARDAMWSPWDAERNAPRAICDASTGAPDPIAGEAWSRFDIAKRLEREPAAIGPLLSERVSILASTRDSFYRNEAVARLKAKLDAWRAEETAAGRVPSDRGRIEVVDDLDDESLRQLAVLRFHRDIAAALRATGHADPIRLDEANRANRPSGESRPVPAPRPGG
jgi:hypothetical protein